MNQQERNQEIIDGYKAGATQDDLAAAHGITPARVWQILNRAGLTKRDRPSVSHKRDEQAFTGVLLPPEVKKALRQAAKADGKSMSAFVAELVRAKLEERGADFEIVKFLKEEDVPLPLES